MSNLAKDYFYQMAAMGSTMSLLFVVIGVLLQFGTFYRNRTMYSIKLILFALFWPLAISMACWSLAAGGSTSDIVINSCCLLFELGCWIYYLVQSFRLWIRTHSIWSFNPETRYMLYFKVHDRLCYGPCFIHGPIKCLVIKYGRVYIDGFHFCDIKKSDTLPEKLYLVAPGHVKVYDKGAAQVPAPGFGVIIFKASTLANYTSVNEHEYETPESVKMYL